MDHLEKFLTIGKALGYEGNALRLFVEKQSDEVRDRDNLEREERVAMRQAKKEEDELVFRREELKLKYELEQLKTEANNISVTSANVAESSMTFRVPKLPCFVEGKDSIDSYLARFEAYAASMKWPRESYALCLSALITGKALDVYSRLPQALTNNYDYLKDALLTKYELTSDDFRKRFFSNRQMSNETAPQFMGKLEHWLNRWVSLSHTEETFEGIRELLLREQFLATCNRDLAVFLREQTVVDRDAMMEMAKRFALAHSTALSPSSGEKDSAKVGLPIPNDASRNGRFSPRNNLRYNSRSNIKCFLCDKPGHIARNCRHGRPQSSTSTRLEKPHERVNCNAGVFVSPSDKSSVGNAGVLVAPNHECSIHKAGAQLKCGCFLPAAGYACVKDCKNLPICDGSVGGTPVKILRDSGCNGVIVRKSLVRPSEFTGQSKSLMMIDRTVLHVPTAMCDILSPIYNGTVEVLCMDDPVCDLILGNIEGVRSDNLQEFMGKNEGVTTMSESRVNRVLEKSECENKTEGDLDDSNDDLREIACAVETRASLKREKAKPLAVAPAVAPGTTTKEFAAAQFRDSSLAKLFERVNTPTSAKQDKSNIHWYEVVDGTLFRFFSRSNKDIVIRQLIVPRAFRNRVLSLGHDCIMAGHLGIRKTLDRILLNFYWPGMFGDVRRFCKSCDICQRTVAKGTITRAPVQNMPLVNVPFQKMSMDIIGPIAPMSDRRHRYILTVVDFATRYPEAIPLREIDAETVAEALLSIFARVGIPRVLLSDNGSQFVSAVMNEVMRLLSIKAVHSTIYHPMSNGLVEKFNGTLKRMLRRMSAERPKDWDRYIEPLLFAYREVPSASTGFSPFELLYGHNVRGPMEILRELWAGGHATEETRNAYEYVIDLRNRIESTCRLAEEHLATATQTYKKHFDKRAKMRFLEVGNKVLILLPTDNNKLLMQWKRPFDVTEKVSSTNYRVQIGTANKLFHINMLKLYVQRESDEVETGVTAGLSIAIIDDEEDELVVVPDRYGTQQTVADVHLENHLHADQFQQLRELLDEYSDIFTELPGNTDLINHEIKVGDSKPVRSKPYPVPFATRGAMQVEVDKMLSLDIIEPSNSPYCSPMLLVKKADGSYRPVIDFRRLNQITVFDAEPIPSPEDIFCKLTDSKYFSKLDFCCGYWQIPLAESDKEKTAFATERGLCQFKRMAFGLVNAGATYTRMMRVLLSGITDVENYIDDVLIYSRSWEEHIAKLREVFDRVRNANLTVKPTKCYFGFSSVEFIGHVVGHGLLQMQNDKICKIRDAKIPATKKQVRAFLGLTGYYHKFIHNYAQLMAPLSDLTKKGMPDRVGWSTQADNAFVALKNLLCEQPVLKLPDFSLPFILRTDASDVGLGAVLLQRHGQIYHPVAYASKKLNHAEQAYATLEKECLAIVWGVRKFNRYLYGKQFTLQTDHQSLQFLNASKFDNNRIMRWSLKLQPYRYHVEHIPGKQNVGADFLSRI